jgi:hypothetical protein
MPRTIYKTRCAKWLLRTNDLAGADLPFTQRVHRSDDGCKGHQHHRSRLRQPARRIHFIRAWSITYRGHRSTARTSLRMSRRYPLALRFDLVTTCANAEEWCQLKKRSQARDLDRWVLTVESAVPSLRWLGQRKHTAARVSASRMATASPLPSRPSKLLSRPSSSAQPSGRQNWPPSSKSYR